MLSKVMFSNVYLTPSAMHSAQAVHKALEGQPDCSFGLSMGGT